MLLSFFSVDLCERTPVLMRYGGDACGVSLRKATSLLLD